MTRKHELTDAQRVAFVELMSTGNDPISFFCSVLADESAPMWARKDAAKELKAYYHPRLAQMGPLIEQFGK